MTASLFIKGHQVQQATDNFTNYNIYSIALPSSHSFDIYSLAWSNQWFEVPGFGQVDMCK